MKRNFASLTFILILNLISALLTGCSSKVYIHDRHIFSYEPVKEYCKKHKNTTLVLLDYHNDIHPSFKTLNSITWVGQLFEEGLIKDLIWVSGRTMEKPNRDARRWWLERNTKEAIPALEEYILSHTKIIDYHDLKKIRMKGNFAVTLDFDILMKDPGPEPEIFVTELATWIREQKPELLTLALSAAYHKNNQAWNYLSIFLKNYPQKARWFINCDQFGTIQESNDEQSAWQMWNLDKNYFQSNELPYYPGAYLWVKAPLLVKEQLLARNAVPQNADSAEILKGWMDELALFSSAPSSSQTENFFQSVHSSLSDLILEPEKIDIDQNIFGPNEQGIAVRLINHGLDRGCLSLYSNVQNFSDAVKYCTVEAATDPRYRNITAQEIPELDVNISFFTEWKTCSSPLDFIPGLHSLILITPDNEKTLLQPSIALERNYTKQQFLETLCKKAGLDKNDWQSEQISFQKSLTFNYYKWH